MSLDSLNSETYERIRKIPESIISLKKEALKNMVKEGIKFSIETTIIKDLNDKDSLAEILTFVAKTNCNLLTLRPLSLCGNTHYKDFSLGNLISPIEVAHRVSDILDISPNYFESWDKFKIALAQNFSKFPFKLIPTFSLGIAYFYKQKNRLVLFIKEENLKIWTERLNNNTFRPNIDSDIIRLLSVEMSHILFGNPAEIELGKNVARIIIHHICSPETVALNEGGYVANIYYQPKEISITNPVWQGDLTQ
jgi:hypothetical protein